MPVEERNIEVKRDAVKEREKVSTENNLIEVVVKQSRGLTDEEKYKLLTTAQNDEIRDGDLNVEFFTTSDGKRKQIKFQKRWLTKNSWLRYCAKEGLQEGWCLSCIFFFTDSEREPLRSFLKKPWLNYNKSKEHLEKHSSKEYHQRAGDRAYNLVKNNSNPQQRVDSRLTDVGDRNFNFNTSILPVIAEAVITCARQRIPLQGHKKDKIDFDSPPLNNEGNFIAVLRPLAKNIPELKGHLTSGPRNARYISKTVQNELIEIAADQIREFYRECLKNSPHFAIIGDEVTLHGKEILSVCLRFLQVDPPNFRVKPEKHEVLLDFHFLERITGQAIAKGILDVLETHAIDVKNCRGQAYDTTASMSSSRTSGQSHIKRVSPDADYQGCCLYSLNLVICCSSQITSMKNMIDHCHQAHLFFRNSPKR